MQVYAACNLSLKLGFVDNYKTSTTRQKKTESFTYPVFLAKYFNSKTGNRTT